MNLSTAAASRIGDLIEQSPPLATPLSSQYAAASLGDSRMAVCEKGMTAKIDVTAVPKPHTWAAALKGNLNDIPER